ncbi:MAG TPA: dihydroorotate dehydrogenase-like protein [Bradyrhizobium sp.]|jgi:dihydroorotate dehydrogenase (fumarate)|nr:dihydroorotate dehydrogenase-like protein [Bradyrhizobium sp.]
MTDLTTRYLGLTLRSPLVASSSPLADSVENIVRLEDHGIAAVVLPSLFEEQLELESRSVDHDLARGSESFAEALSFFPDMQTYNLGPDRYLELIRRAKERVDIPVIASLNGVTPGGWTQYARLMEEAGADAVELNIYAIATDPLQPGEDVERDQRELVTEIRRSLRIPMAVKLSPFFSAPANMGLRLDQAGANALVLFNRFYQPDFNIDDLEVVPTLSLSRSEELLVRLHWTAILYGHVRADLGITGGVHSAEDVVKCVMAGARVAFMASALLKNGIRHASQVLSDLARWLDAHEYVSIAEMCGSMSYDAVPNATAYERGNYMKVLSSYTLKTRALHE